MREQDIMQYEIHFGWWINLDSWIQRQLTVLDYFWSLKNFQSVKLFLKQNPSAKFIEHRKPLFIFPFSVKKKLLGVVI